MEKSLVEASVPSTLVQNSQAVARLLHHLERRRLPLLALDLLDAHTFGMEAAAKRVTLTACVNGLATPFALQLHTCEQCIGKPRVATNYTARHALIFGISGLILLSI